MNTYIGFYNNSFFTYLVFVFKGHNGYFLSRTKSRSRKEFDVFPLRAWREPT